MPSWTHQVERGITFAYFLIFLQSVYVLYLRVKAKKFYFFKANSLGLLQLDRANHMAICECLYSRASIAEQVCRDRAVSGDLHLGWASFLLGTKYMFASLCIIVFQWLCVSNCAVTEWRSMEAHQSRDRHFMPRIVAWMLHIWLASTIVGIIVPLIWTARGLFIECHQINIIVKHVIHALLNAASTFSPQQFKPADLSVKLLPLNAVSPHAVLLLRYSYIQCNFCLITSAIILVTYTPFLVLTFRSFHKRRALNDQLRKQQWQVLTHALIQYKTYFVSIPIMAYMRSLPPDSSENNPKYWIALRIVLGLESSISGVV